MLPDDELDRLLRDARETYHAPGEPPLDAMWAEVEHSHFASRARSGVRRGLSFRAASLAAAATLMLGVGIGRWTARDSALGTRDSAVAAAIQSRVPSPQSPVSAPVAATTSQYLGQTAALLVALRRDAEAGRTDRRFAVQASELLSTTRLLLDSPAAVDPELRNLLEDLELVLAQIARIPARQRTPESRAELELITRALEQHDVVPRLRSAAAGLANGLSSGSSDD